MMNIEDLRPQLDEIRKHPGDSSVKKYKMQISFPMAITGENLRRFGAFVPDPTQFLQYRANGDTLETIFMRTESCKVFHYHKKLAETVVNHYRPTHWRHRRNGFQVHKDCLVCQRNHYCKTRKSSKFDLHFGWHWCGGQLQKYGKDGWERHPYI